MSVNAAGVCPRCGVLTKTAHGTAEECVKALHVVLERSTASKADGKIVCGFCGEPYNRVRAMVSGPRVAVCAVCIDLMHEIVLMYEIVRVQETKP